MKAQRVGSMRKVPCWLRCKVRESDASRKRNCWHRRGLDALPPRFTSNPTELIRQRHLSARRSSALSVVAREMRKRTTNNTAGGAFEPDDVVAAKLTAVEANVIRSVPPANQRRESVPLVDLSQIFPAQHPNRTEISRYRSMPATFSAIVGGAR